MHWAWCWSMVVYNSQSAGMQIQSHSGTAAGTVGGTLLSVITTIQGEDMLRTAVMALIGAVVSFTASLFMRWISRKITGR